jgi:hypothetical protein
MNGVRAVLVAAWITAAALLGLVAGTLLAVPAVMEQRLAPGVIPSFFTAVTIAVSPAAAALVRLIPGVARAYSAGRLILASSFTWPLAWWLGVRTKDALHAASSHGIFEISAAITHVTVGGLVAVVALAVVLAQRRVTTPRGTAVA